MSTSKTETTPANTKRRGGVKVNGNKSSSNVRNNNNPSPPHSGKKPTTAAASPTSGKSSISPRAPSTGSSMSSNSSESSSTQSSKQRTKTITMRAPMNQKDKRGKVNKIDEIKEEEALARMKTPDFQTSKNMSECDCEIRTSKRGRLFVHRSVLSMWSPTFDELFRSIHFFIY